MGSCGYDKQSRTWRKYFLIQSVYTYYELKGLKGKAQSRGEGRRKRKGRSGEAALVLNIIQGQRVEIMEN